MGMHDDDDGYLIAETMIQCGGGFVHMLGQLWLKGDPENRRRIQATWPEYWAKYRALGVERAKAEGR